MPKFDDSLRGYAFPIHLRDQFTCRYCGADGKKSFSTWLTLSWDHLLPKEHPERNNPEFIVTACQFCNTAANHYFEQAEANGITFDGKTPDELVAQRLPFVLKTRESYRDFWEEKVKGQKQRN